MGVRFSDWTNPRVVISDINGLVDNGIADVLVVANIRDSDDGIADDGLILDGMGDDLIVANIIEVRMVNVGVCSTLEEGHGVGTEGTPETERIIS